MIENLKNCKKTVGIKQSLRAIESGTAKIVYIARDADEKVVNSIKESSGSNSLEIVYVDNMKQLGKACGIEVGAAVACLLKGS